MMTYRLATFTAAVILAASPLLAADIYGLSNGNPMIKSAGPMAFGPDGVLFVGDPMGAAVFAIQTGDKEGDATSAEHNLDGVQEAVAEALGAAANEVTINDMAVNPQTGNVFLLATKSDHVSLLKLHGEKVENVKLDGVAFAKKELSDAPAADAVDRRGRSLRSSTITDLAFVNGEIIVSGVRSGEAASGVRTMVFPFNKADKGASLEIFHANHGRSESGSPIQTFVPFVIDGEPNLLAGFVCTPLVKFPVSAVTSGSKIEGTTLAELGNRNVPLDMFVYEKNGQRYLLMSNSARGVMKISTEDIERDKGLTEKVSDLAGQTYDRVDEKNDGWKNVVQLDKLNDTHAVVLVNDGGQINLRTLELP